MKRMRFYKDAFTLIELLVVIAIIAILAAILFPVFGRARENARRSSCQSNLKQWGLAVQMYKQDYDETMVLSDTSNIARFWPITMEPYVKSYQIAVCPSHATPLTGWAPYPGISYVFIQGGFTDPAAVGTNAIKNLTDPLVEWPSEYVFMSELRSKHPDGTGIGSPHTGPNQEDDPLGTDGSTASGKSRIDYRHFEGTNCLYYDGHVKWAKAGSLKLKPNLLRNNNCTLNNPWW